MPYPFASERSFAAIGYLASQPTESGTQKFAEKLLADGVVKPGDKIVSSTGMKGRTLLYAWYLRAQLFGRDRPHDITDPRFQQELRDLGIDYYFLYEPAGSVPMDVSAFGTVKATYDMTFSCVGVNQPPADGCRLSLVSIQH
jgi:hypothetical protein